MFFRGQSARRCPYCGGQIRAEAVKCRYCGAFLEAERRVCWLCRVVAGICGAILLAGLAVLIFQAGLLR